MTPDPTITVSPETEVPRKQGDQMLGSGGPPPSRSRLRGVAGRFSLLLALLIVIGLFSLLKSDSFPTKGTFDAVIGTNAPLLLVSLAVMLPLTAGDFDLSVGAIVGFCMCIVAVLTVQHGWSWPLASVAAMGAAVAIGMVNAFLTGILRINAFIATLGTSTILAGLTAGITGSTTVGPVPSGLTSFAVNTWFYGLPLVVLYALIAVAILWYLMAHTPAGRYLYFTGGGPEAARLAGLPVRSIKMATFVGAAIVCGFAGVLSAGQVGAGDPSSGPLLLLPAYAAAFLGATTITPGRYNAWGTLLALYLIEVTVTGLQQVGVPFWTEQVFVGLVLVVAVAGSRFISDVADD